MPALKSRLDGKGYRHLYEGNGLIRVVISMLGQWAAQQDLQLLPARNC
jgi:hypothetical protein